MSSGARIIIFLQARSSSSRLPMKALLPIGGMPLALLVAKRAMNRDRPLLLTTSDEPSDDALSALFKGEGIEVFRGDLDDPLARFEAAARPLRDDDWIIRITGDNPLPDGELLERLVRESEARTLDYLRIDAERSRLPYGVSAEIFRVERLREAAHFAVDPHDREHITPWIRRAVGDATLHPTTHLAPAEKERNAVDRSPLPHPGALRATIDSARDYERMLRVFQGIDDPVAASLDELIERLREIDLAAPRVLLPRDRPRLMLGTAQLGLDYGIANQTGRPNRSECRAILETAFRAGASGIDTARVYGDAETRIAEVFSSDPALELPIATKIAPLNEQPSARRGDTDEALALRAELSLFHSLHALQKPRIESLLFHRFHDLERLDGAGLERFRALQRDGYFRHLGVSVQSPEEAFAALRYEAIGEIQFPMNLLDARFDSFVREASTRPQVKLVARSVFLQGLVLMREGALPRMAGASEEVLRAVSQKLDEAVEMTRSKSRLNLAIRFMRAFSRIDALVIGAETRAQLEEILLAFCEPPLSLSEVKALRSHFGRLPESLLDPSKWKISENPAAATRQRSER
ncbi:MAG: NTP transferase domain-containing protein [Sandaracinaceae bacterium]|nr:NTP transferase domain-containing protein [Sandaracinaceae bacterium]